MNYFLWVMVVTLAVDVVGKGLMVGTGMFPPRSRGATCFDLILNVVLLCWVVSLLIGVK